MLPLLLLTDRGRSCVDDVLPLSCIVLLLVVLLLKFDMPMLSSSFVVSPLIEEGDLVSLDITPLSIVGD